MPKRRRGSTSAPAPPAKRSRTRHPDDHIDALSDELLISILRLLPPGTVTRCQRVSQRFYTLAGDSQIWKGLYQARFVQARARRQVVRVDDAGTVTDWKAQYKLRHNWTIGACAVREIRMTDPVPPAGMLVEMAAKVVVTVDETGGLRAWSVREGEMIARSGLEGQNPTCLAVDEKGDGLGVAVGFEDGGWAVWRLDILERKFTREYQHPESKRGRLAAIAYLRPYVMMMTDSQLLSLYRFDEETVRQTTKGPNLDPGPGPESDTTTDTHPTSSLPTTKSPQSPQPRLLTTLQSHTTFPPFTLSLRSTPTHLLASIIHPLPLYPSGHTLSMQELSLSHLTSRLTSRLTTALPTGFSFPSPSSSSSKPPTHPLPKISSIAYTHPSILTTHPDNTLSLTHCTSTRAALRLEPQARLYGHTAGVRGVKVGRGRAVSVGMQEVRVWELGGRSVKVDAGGGGAGWVGFDEEVVVVRMVDGEAGGDGLRVCDFR